MIADIASSFNTSYKENFEEYTAKLPAAIGKWGNKLSRRTEYISIRQLRDKLSTIQ